MFLISPHLPGFGDGDHAACLALEAPSLPQRGSKAVPGAERGRRGVQRGAIAAALMALEPAGDMAYAREDLGTGPASSSDQTGRNA